MEMEMRAMEDLKIGEDLTPSLPPLSFALHNSHLHSHCSSCFSPISSPSFSPPTTPPFLNYCSPNCFSADSPLHFSTAEHHLFLHNPIPPSSDLRASLRLLHRLHLSPSLPRRIAGLLTNRDSLSQDDDTLIRDGARVMAVARAMRDGREFDGDCELEASVLCAVMTNSVEVGEPSVGIAVYDWRFSWINHSCSPNSCFRFSLCSDGDSECSSLRISPVIQEVEDQSLYNQCDLVEGCSSFGPRLVVRSIKTVKRGDEVTITYTDLMQPRALRQSDLWFKYQFSCNCIRCSMVSLSYVDHSLQETFHVDLQLTMTCSVSRDRLVEEMRDYFDCVISEYMSAGDPKSCCVKIENLLIGRLLRGNIFPNEPFKMDFCLSPIHNLSLSAYTALSSAYKIQSGLMENASKAFYMIRISTAYSLLLAGATHHLFISEPSLIASAANLWTYAGESLVYFAKSTFQPSSVDQSSPTSLSFASLVCDKCCLLDKFSPTLSSRVAGYEDLNKVSQQFLQCMTSIAPHVWSFLVQDCSYLTEIEDPVNFSWLGPLRTSNLWKFATQSLDGDRCSGQGSRPFGIQNGEHGLPNEDSTAANFARKYDMD